MLHTSALTLFLDGAPLLTLPPLRVAPGEVLTLMGPSGCGKSSLLAALAGVLPPGGPIRLTGDILLGTHRLTPLPPQERGVGILFQDDLLFAHLTVAENLMFGMPAHLKGMAARQTRAHEALAEVGLEAQADKLPGALSGGQKARVSLLRALLAEPRALLLDEPFSRLDKPLRAAFRTLVFERLRTQAIPALLVTHDEEDAPGTILQLIPPAIPEEEHHLV
ncbi:MULTISPECIES: ATP-binding cassette domain-containing protein [Aeromonas]|jgi:putative thiamine transport system ATP-binding protein|uniref:ATP-binding cassette domain-containing protein n=1 Tax=Aeromonas caviae TaxID=648 RepID=A0AA42VAK4_AERCA|nr:MULTISPECIES: ATP-binding cassette domain-containing protein [Aeromonas]MBP6791070.1 ATP-binding cassette domain-containing protein [Aeromonas sp.]MBP8282216.1 ATP-binding cassette domain-containing protein [Aeromonas sp.]MBP9661667.1 ATP-binding cassette domain-containing protein [Aeromonas sp.]MDH1897434.1 ATP-binding cassette domain-containing protein [Aeromonas caviae]MDK3165045.1 ATP-binding cassette domain-containing protein [Aeromonas caviae]